MIDVVIISIPFSLSNPGGQDYSPLSGLLLIFPSGSGPNDSLSFNVAITDDSLVEFGEYFTVGATSMDSAVTFAPGRDTATVNILDDDGKFIFFQSKILVYQANQDNQAGNY